MRILLAFTALILPFCLSAQEPSAFGAGDLDSPEPYGLTSSEKTILKNKNIIKTVEKQAHSQGTKIDSLRERMDGLQTILEGLMDKSQSNKVELNRMLSSNESDEMTAQEREASTTARLNQFEESIKANEQNILNFKTVMDEFSMILDGINSNYVSKAEYNVLVNDVNSFKMLVGKELKSISKKSVSSSSGGDPYTGVSSRDLAKRALANYKRKHFSKAIPEYEELIRRKHKPAFAHYMIAEMWYYRKKYDQAISYFKASASLYDQASYMPTLLLHSGVAMKYTGDTENAQAFLQAVVLKYPESSEALSAQEQLDRF